MKKKRCSKCNKVLLVSEFSKNKYRKDGLGGWCRACAAEATKRWAKANPKKMYEATKRWAKANPEKMYEAVKRYRQAHPEKRREADKSYRQKHLEKMREKERRYREANREKCREQNKHYRKTNREKCREYNKQYQQAHSEKAREYIRKRRAHKLAVAENFTAEQEAFVMGFQQGRCALCGQDRPPFHIDHWRPLSKGYPLTPGNAVVLCASCNAKKHNAMPEELYSAEVLARVATMLAEQEKLWKNNIDT